jgi:imidazoleglycerol-phosphate dehydratase/histidinol-phosphatase
MLDQIARHGQMDLKLRKRFRVDEHHTIEDTAIALGEVFAKALGNKLGIERYGFCLPMDDCLAQVAIDFEVETGWFGKPNSNGRWSGKCQQRCFAFL